MPFGYLHAGTLKKILEVIQLPTFLRFNKIEKQKSLTIQEMRWIFGTQRRC